MTMPWFPTRKTITAVLEGSHDDARGSATITLERVKGMVCFKLAWSGIGSPVAACIHEGEPGSEGCAVLPLFIDNPKRRGCVSARKSLIRTIAERPGSYHVRLQTQRQPHGALQGQF